MQPAAQMNLEIVHTMHTNICLINEIMNDYVDQNNENVGFGPSNNKKKI